MAWHHTFGDDGFGRCLACGKTATEHRARERYAAYTHAFRWTERETSQDYINAARRYAGMPTARD